MSETIEDAAVIWWESHRPTGWSILKHCGDPAVNTSSSAEAALAHAVANAIQSGRA